MQAKWYYYVLLGLVDVEANFLGKSVHTNDDPAFVNMFFLFVINSNQIKKLHLALSFLNSQNNPDFRTR